ncbi:MAG: GNAT family protein [Gemmataceae bacterium]
MTESLVNLFHPPPTIDVDEIRLRPLRADDAEALHAYLRNPVVTELTSYPVMSVSIVEAMIEKSLTRWAAGEPSKWGVSLLHDDRLIGTCGFNEWSRVHRWAELAYDLAPAYWGRGLMARAVTQVVQWAFRHDLVDRVQAYVRVDNERSSRLLERGGFLREGCLRGYRVCRGQHHDFYIYGLLRSDDVTAQGSAGKQQQVEQGASPDPISK